MLLRDGPQPRLRSALRDLGSALRSLHALAEPAPHPGVGPRGLDRLDTWLAGRSPVASAGRAGFLLRRTLGETRWLLLQDWSTAVRTDSTAALAHGAPGLGSLVVDARSGGAQLLFGEDVCTAPWYFDLGWVVGELVELTWYAGGDTHPWQDLTNELFAGYGRDPGDRWNRMAVLRIALHLHDFTAYVGWNDQEFRRYAAFLTYLIDL
ncbi:hypothetical protein [Kitasatospora sp. NPDC059827]|uniref:hypothetical protein n=1 Tax=Kitasatospora sp. NPDC059827 TaxID=3346964 RepID=UPI00365E4064